jgi:hypothetical protein
MARRRRLERGGPATLERGAPTIAHVDSNRTATSPSGDAAISETGGRGRRRERAVKDQCAGRG